MHTIELSPRMKAVADMVAYEGVVADIGCDHAFVSIYLATVRQVNKVIASDVRTGPVDIARANVAAYGLANVIDVRMGDGLEKLAGEAVDTIVIAGMGGMLMTRILEDGANVVAGAKQLVLQPQSDLYAVRKYLHEKGHAIVAEEMLVDAGKYYTVMDVGVGEGSGALSELELQFGPCLLAKKSAVLQNWLTEQNHKNAAILADLKEKNTASALVRIAELQELQQAIGQALALYN